MDFKDNNRKALASLLIDKIVDTASDAVSTNICALLHDLVKMLVDEYLKTKEIGSHYLPIADTMIDMSRANCELKIKLFGLKIETDADAVEHSKAFLKDCNLIIAGMKRLNERGSVSMLDFVTSGKREANDGKPLILHLGDLD